MPRFDAGASLALIERIGSRTASGCPPCSFACYACLEETRGHDLAQPPFAIHAAAPCPIGIKEAMLDWWGPILYEYYSGTEGNGQTAISPEEWLTHKGSVGRPILGQLRSQTS